MRNARPGGPYRAAPSSLAVSHRAAQHCPDCRVEYVASATTCADCGSDLARGRAPVPPNDRVVPFEDVADPLGPPDRQSLRDWVRGAIIAPAALGVLLLLCAPFMPAGPFLGQAEASEAARGLGWLLLAVGAALLFFAAQIPHSEDLDSD